jgi:hypothetical protein
MPEARAVSEHPKAEVALLDRTRGERHELIDQAVFVG